MLHYFDCLLNIPYYFATFIPYLYYLCIPKDLLHSTVMIVLIGTFPSLTIVCTYIFHICIAISKVIIVITLQCLLRKASQVLYYLIGLYIFIYIFDKQRARLFCFGRSMELQQNQQADNLIKL